MKLYSLIKFIASVLLLILCIIIFKLFGLIFFIALVFLWIYFSEERTDKVWLIKNIKSQRSWSNVKYLSSFLSKSSEADFASAFLYHTLSGMINSYCGSGKICRIHTFGKKCIEFGKFCRTNSADFAYSFYIFCLITIFSIVI